MHVPPMCTLRGHRGYVTSVRFRAPRIKQETLLLSTSTLGEVFIWDLKLRRPIAFIAINSDSDFASKESHCVNHCVNLLSAEWVARVKEPSPFPNKRGIVDPTSLEYNSGCIVQTRDNRIILHSFERNTSTESLLYSFVPIRSIPYTAYSYCNVVALYRVNISLILPTSASTLELYTYQCGEPRMTGEQTRAADNAGKSESGKHDQEDLEPSNFSLHGPRQILPAAVRFKSQVIKTGTLMCFAECWRESDNSSLNADSCDNSCISLLVGYESGHLVRWSTTVEIIDAEEMAKHVALPNAEQIVHVSHHPITCLDCLGVPICGAHHEVGAKQAIKPVHLAAVGTADGAIVIFCDDGKGGLGLYCARRLTSSHTTPQDPQVPLPVSAIDSSESEDLDPEGSTYSKPIGIGSVAFRPDGKYLIALGWDSAYRVIDVVNNAQVVHKVHLPCRSLISGGTGGSKLCCVRFGTLSCPKWIQRTARRPDRLALPENSCTETCQVESHAPSSRDSLVKATTDVTHLRDFAFGGVELDVFAVSTGEGDIHVYEFSVTDPSGYN